MQSVLNVRMDSVLKERGDKVLAEHGISVSSAVRSLWEELATSREIPDFIKDSSDAEVQKVRRKRALETLCSIGAFGTGRIDLSLLDKDAVRNMQYEEKWKEYEALK